VRDAEVVITAPTVLVQVYFPSDDLGVQGQWVNMPLSATTYTADSGSFSAALNIPAGDPRNVPLTVTVYPQTQPEGNGAGLVADAVSVMSETSRLNLPWVMSTISAAFSIPAPGAPPANNTFNVSHLDIDSTKGLASAAFPIFDDLVTASRYYAVLDPSATSSITSYIDLSDPNFVPKYTTWTFGQNIQLGQNFEYAVDLIVHEYGHFVADESGFADDSIPDGKTDHYPWASLSAVAGSKNVGVALAFQEGWANYYSIVAQLNQPPVMSVAWTGQSVALAGEHDTSYSNIVVSSGQVQQQFSFDLASNSYFGQSSPYTAPLGGDDNEVVIARFLYDLANSPLIGQPAVFQYADGSMPVLHVAGLMPAQTLSDLWRNLMRGVTDNGQRMQLGAMLEQERVMAYNLAVTVNGAPPAGPLSASTLPVFNWSVPTYMNAVVNNNVTPATATPTRVPYPVGNAFSIEFFDANNQQITDPNNPKGPDAMPEDGFEGTVSTLAAGTTAPAIGGSFTTLTANQAATAAGASIQFSWQPTQNQWKYLVSKNVAYWVIISRSSPDYGPPAAQNAQPFLQGGNFVPTGDYWSGAQPITIAQAPAVGAGSAVQGQTGIIQITLAQPAPVNETIDYEVTNETASWGTNFTLAYVSYPDEAPLAGAAPLQTGTVYIPAGQTEVDVTVQTYDVDEDTTIDFQFSAWLDGDNSDTSSGDFQIYSDQSGSGGGSGSGTGGSGGTGSGGTGGGGTWGSGTGGLRSTWRVM
jgi:uncharacterized membrane protein YgcG